MTANVQSEGLEGLEISEIAQGLTAIVLAPIMLPLAAALDQPLAKETLKEGIAFSQRCQETVEEAWEEVEDTLAEVQSELKQEQQEIHLSSKSAQHYIPHTKAEASVEVMEVMADLNEECKRLSNGIVDLQLLLPLGLGTLALRQLICEGLQLEKIPWFTFAWYSLDSFIKLYDRDPSPLPPDHENHNQESKDIPTPPDPPIVLPPEIS